MYSKHLQVATLFGHQKTFKSDQLFWIGGLESFEGQDEACDNMHFVDDEVISDLHQIIFTFLITVELSCLN